MIALRKIGLVSLVGLLFLLLGSCRGRGSSEEEKPLLAVTIAPTASLVTELSDNSLEVLTLLPRGTAPELYEPDPQSLISLSRAKAYLYVGELGFELSWLDRLGELYPTLPLIRLGEGCHGEQHEVHRHEAEGRHDPHYWTSMRGIRLMARNTYKALLEIFPESDSLYSARYTALEGELSRLEETIKQQLELLQSRAFVIYHPALTDFAEEFNLEQLAIEQDGKEPSPMQLRTLVERAKALGVRTVFIQEEFDQKLARGIADELGAKVILINPLGKDWRGELTKIVDALLNNGADQRTDL